MEINKKVLAGIGLCFIVTYLVVSHSNYTSEQNNYLTMRIDYTVDIINNQLEQYPTEVNYIINLYGKEQYLKIGNVSMKVWYGKPLCPCKGKNDQFNVGYLDEIPLGENYLYYPEAKFNEFYEKYIIGNDNLTKKDIEYYVSFIQSKKMTEEGSKNVRSLKLWILKKLSRWWVDE